MRRPARSDRDERPETAFRGFVAVLLPDVVRAEVARVAVPLRDLGDVKWVAPENYHLTLKFLGRVSRDGAAALGESLRAAAAGMTAFRFRLGGLGAFPKPARPQTVWVGVTLGEEALGVLARAIEDTCRARGFEREGRPFHAHLTLGRARSPVGQEALAAQLVAGAETEIGAFDVDAIHLMKSTLLPSGPIYSVEQTFPLGLEDR